VSQEVTEQKKSIDIKAKIGPEAERLFAQQKEILTSYQRALNILRSKRLHPQIAPFIPLDLPENEVTGTLGDWANTPELERLEDEALQELLLLEVRFFHFFSLYHLLIETCCARAASISMGRVRSFANRNQIRNLGRDNYQVARGYQRCATAECIKLLMLC
jgi:hypothetical protein